MGLAMILGCFLGGSSQKQPIQNDPDYIVIQPERALALLAGTQQQGWFVRFFNLPLWPF